MKIFISWSGDSSKAIAEIFRGWIPSVIQAAKPYFSPDDISKGSRWNTEITKELQDCAVGLICLTSENLEAPWIMFEAGALSKSLSISKVCPLLFGIEPSEVKGPLVQFQAAPFTKSEMKKTIKMMNEILDTESLESDVLDSVFEMWWPKLEERVKKVLTDFEIPKNLRIRTDRDIMEEILDRVRATHPVRNISSPHPVYRDLYYCANSLAKKIDSDDFSDIQAIKDACNEMMVPISYLSQYYKSIDGFDDSLETNIRNQFIMKSRNEIEHLKKEILEQPTPQKEKFVDQKLIKIDKKR